MFNNKTALIFGISGQDGAYLANLLLGKGYSVCGTSRDKEIASFRNLARLGILDKINLESASLTDFRSVFRVFNKTNPHEVYNLAGQTSVGLSFDQPVEAFESISVGTLNLLEAVRFSNQRIKLYNACSSECYGYTGAEAANENSPFRPRSPYAVAKAAAFWEVANYRDAYDLFACSGILFNHESPLRPKRFVTQKIVSAAKRIAAGSKEKLVLGNITIERDWGWAPEYVEAMWLMLQQETADDFVIATGKSVKLEKFIDHTFSILNLDWRAWVEFDQRLVRPSEIDVSRGDASKAHEILGWRAKYKINDVVEMMVRDAVHA